MEETKRKFPSLPPNYVSLQQLQEQRLRKQQQKKEDEEEGLKEEKEKQKQQKEAEDEEEKKKKLLVSQKTPPRIKSYDQTSSANRNGRNYFSQKSWLIKEKNEEAVVDQKLEEVESKGRNKKNNNRYKGNGTLEIQKGEIEINVVDVQTEELLPPDPDQNLKEIKTKKKKRKKRYKGKKSMIIEEETLIEENMKESLPQATTTIPNENDADDDVKNTRRTAFRRIRNQKPPPESMNQTMVIEQKIGDLKICDDDDDDDDEKKKKSTVEKKKKKKKKKKKNDDYSYYSMRRPRNLMWIRKDEKTSDETPVSSGGKI